MNAPKNDEYYVEKIMVDLRFIVRYMDGVTVTELAENELLLDSMAFRLIQVQENAKNLTQAIMELGESLCIPNGEAKCSQCPLRGHCVANKESLTDQLPVKTPKKARRIEARTVLLLSCRGKYAICRRPETGLLAKLWEYPNLDGHLSEEEIFSWMRERGITPISVRPIENAVHIFTHVEWHMIGYAAECMEETSEFYWYTADEIKEKFAIPTAFRAYTKQLE